MHVVLYGATGRAGSRILKELLSRGHEVTAIVRGNGASTEAGARVTERQDDLSNAQKTAGIIEGADAVISAYAPPQDDTDRVIDVTKLFVEAVGKSGVKRFLMVGGAGGLEVAPGVSLIDSGHLPPEWMAISRSHVKALEELKKSNINWTYFAPAGFFEPGERTGKFRLGTNNLISNEKGESRISMEDYAIAMVDELENPKYERQRFSIGY